MLDLDFATTRLFIIDLRVTIWQLFYNPPGSSRCDIRSIFWRHLVANSLIINSPVSASNQKMMIYVVVTWRVMAERWAINLFRNDDYFN